jgi:hypothetical protein
MKFEEILETCKANTQAKSWDEFAWMLGLSTEGLRLIRKGRGALKPATLEAIMRGSNLDAPLIVAIWEAEHGKNPHVRQSWISYLENRESPTPKKECEEKQDVEKMCIMLSKPEFSQGWQRLEDQRLTHDFGQTEKTRFPPMGIRSSVTCTGPEENATGTPLAHWHERRRHPPRHWDGPERRRA